MQMQLYWKDGMLTRPGRRVLISRDRAGREALVSCSLRTSTATKWIFQQSLLSLTVREGPTLAIVSTAIIYEQSASAWYINPSGPPNPHPTKTLWSPWESAPQSLKSLPHENVSWLATMNWNAAQCESPRPVLLLASFPQMKYKTSNKKGGDEKH